MGFLTKQKEKRDNIKRLLSLHGSLIKYTTKIVDDTEIVLGKNGNISIKDNEIIILSSSKIVFRGNIQTTECLFHISGDGVILKGTNIETNEEHQIIIAYFVNHIK